MIQADKVFVFDSLERSNGTCSTSWLVPSDCPYLEGHFPQLPVLPAVGLIDGSLEFIRSSGTSYPSAKLALRKAKLTGMVTPGMKVQINLLHKDNRVEVEWRRAETLESLASFSFQL